MRQEEFLSPSVIIRGHDAPLAKMLPNAGFNCLPAAGLLLSAVEVL